MDLIMNVVRLFWRDGMLGMLLLTLVVSVVCFMCITQYKLWTKYSQIPGPLPVPLLGNLLEFLADDTDVLRTMYNFTKRFNGISKIWLGLKPMVLITDPEHLQIFYTNPTMLDRADVYDHIAEVVNKDSIFCSNGQQWKKTRKMFMMTFHMIPNDSIFQNFLTTWKDLSKTLHKRADGRTFSIQQILKTTLFNSIQLSSINSQMSETEALEILNAINYLQHMVYIRQFTIHLRYNWLFYLLPSGRRFQKDLKLCKSALSEGTIRAYNEMTRMIENGEPVPNLYLFNMFRKFGDEPFQAIESEFMNVILAGTETTSQTICYVLIIFGLFPDIQERVYQEDQNVIKSLGGNKLQVTDMEKYEFLDRVIKETLRLFPNGPILARKLGEDTFFGKYLVPKGTDVAAVPFHTYRNPEIFPDPLKFDPDRFLPENAAKIHPYAFKPFSAGSRGCPGTRYALIAAKTFVSAIVREFVVISHYKSLDEVYSNISAEVTLNDKQGFPIRLLPRKPAVV